MCHFQANHQIRKAYTPLFLFLEKPWESISMDYMSGLSSTKQGNDCVFVVIDRFSKMAILTVCKKNIIVEDTAKIFFKRVWFHFGIPHTIISDWDNKFLNTFWSSLWSCWTPSSQNPLFSTPKPMTKQRSSIK
jgi:hypothetical protein